MRLNLMIYGLLLGLLVTQDAAFLLVEGIFFAVGIPMGGTFSK